MINFQRLASWLFPDKRPDREKEREREFIRAANKLQTLKVSRDGGMSIDPEELREQIITAREQLKHLVHKQVTPSRSFNPVAGQGESPIVEAPGVAQDSVEVVAWRRLANGASVRYVCLQSTSTGGYSVATASLFSEDAASLPRWIYSDTHGQVASALQGELHWYATVSEAMNAWDAEL
ncbi:hypothetical protein [Pseudomonas cichorii]|uniref:Uncharacterized protein n=1 Tax=Pseudomonas cichorii TaxID=36746 RepID=A0A3M4WF00_PSECI|nr:hypothetical protein [Pseudomonas cichorii]RMR62277.1 hypothetical protein ALP84_200061 [Pseudomonas cichorii]